MRTLIASFVLLATSAYGLDSGPSVPLRGYTAEHSATEVTWEQKFRAVPEPMRVRDNMQRLSARPHHVGSPYDKDNAD